MREARQERRPERRHAARGRSRARGGGGGRGRRGRAPRVDDDDARARRRVARRYRNLIGAPQDIYSGIFIKPTDVQRALAMAPELRDQRAVRRSRTRSRTSTSSAASRSPSGTGSRRSLSTSCSSPATTPFCQGEHSGCMCVVLSGAISMRMRSEDAAALSEAVGMIRSGEHFGHGALMSTTDDVGPNNKKAAGDHANQVHRDESRRRGRREGREGQLRGRVRLGDRGRAGRDEKDRMRRQERDSMLLETYQAECATELIVVPKDTFDALLRRRVRSSMAIHRFATLGRLRCVGARRRCGLARFTRMRVRGPRRRRASPACPGVTNKRPVVFPRRCCHATPCFRRTGGRAVRTHLLDQGHVPRDQVRRLRRANPAAHRRDEPRARAHRDEIHACHNSLKDCSAKGDATMTADHFRKVAARRCGPAARYARHVRPGDGLASHAGGAATGRAQAFDPQIRARARRFRQGARARARARCRSMRARPGPDSRFPLLRFFVAGGRGQGRQEPDGGSRHAHAARHLRRNGRGRSAQGYRARLGDCRHDGRVPFVLHKVHIQTCDVTLDWLSTSGARRASSTRRTTRSQKTQASRIKRQVRHARPSSGKFFMFDYGGPAVSQRMKQK